MSTVDARSCKPLDQKLIRRLAKEHQILTTVEEGSIGEFGSHVVQFLALDRPAVDVVVEVLTILVTPNSLKNARNSAVASLVLPFRYIDHGTPRDQYAEAGLTVAHIALISATVLNVMSGTREALELMSSQLGGT